MSHESVEFFGGDLFSRSEVLETVAETVKPQPAKLISWSARSILGRGAALSTVAATLAVVPMLVQGSLVRVQPTAVDSAVASFHHHAAQHTSPLEALLAPLQSAGSGLAAPVAEEARQVLRALSREPARVAATSDGNVAIYLFSQRKVADGSHARYAMFDCAADGIAMLLKDRGQPSTVIEDVDLAALKQAVVRAEAFVSEA